MLTDEQLIDRVRAALERETAEIVPPAALLEAIHGELRRPPAGERHRWRRPSRRPRLRPAQLAPVAALLVVVAVVAVFLGVESRKPAGSAAKHGGFTLVFRAEPTAQVRVVNSEAVARAVSVMRRRIASVLPSAASSIAVSGAGTKVFVQVGSRAGISRERLLSLVGTTARLAFYDWEANALTPSGKPVSSLLATQTQNGSALEISQGGAALAPGSAGAGSMPLYAAVAVASKQPYHASSDNTRAGPEYFAFGAAGSTACTRAAQTYHVTAISGRRCYLAGPQDTLQDLDSVLPPSVSASEAQVLTVQRGTIVLQAVPASYSHVPEWFDPTAQFFVLRDHVSLFGNEITHPRAATDPSGAADVTFGFTPQGASAFENVTANIAHRGALVSNFGQQYDQHFAVALDTQLLTVPSIDFKAYPDGIRGDEGGDIAGPFTIQSARDLASQLRLGWLPVNLKLIAVVSRH